MLFFSRQTLLKTTQIVYWKPTKFLSLIVPRFILQVFPTSTTSINLRPLNAKISNYMRNGFTQEAQYLFDQMPERNTVSWNAMIRGYFQNEQLNKAMNLFNNMPERDVVSYNTVIAGLMQSGDVDGAREVFDRVPSKDIVTWNSMVAGYVDNDLIDEAVRLFERMLVRDVISWNTVLGGLVYCGNISLAEEYFKQMSARDVVSWTVMISGLAKVGRICEARELFESMPIRDVRAWNAMMVGYIENGYIKDAEVLFQNMPEKDFSSWNELINGLANNEKIIHAMMLFMEMPQKSPRTWNSVILGFIRYGLIKEAHTLLEKSPFSNMVSWTNMIVGYFNLGDVDSAIKIFELMDVKDAAVWNAAIFGLGENDFDEDGIKLFMRMKREGPSPDKATFTSVLTICSHLPALCLGKQIHAHMIQMGFDHVIEISNAMVTMYARCGNMNSALLEFSSMSFHDVISWNSIICGFAHHGYGEEAVAMFEQMRLTDVQPNHITFVGVLSACSHAGLVAQGRYYFNFMRNKCFLQPTSEHYTCIVDLLGRFGLIDEAMKFLDQMRADGVEIPLSVWGALLGASRIHKNINVGEMAGKMILELEPHNSGVYLILAEQYLCHGRREEAKRILIQMKQKGIKKQPGCSWIEVNNNGHVFLSGDSSHPEFAKICFVLESLYTEMEFEMSKSNAAPLEDLRLLFDGYYS